MDGDVVSEEKVIAAPAEAIFALLADASRHKDFDGSGTVREAKPGAPERLCAGATFGMSMKMGVRYSMVSTVIEFEENRRIVWQSRPRGFMGKVTGGRIWRYELEPQDGQTLVRESWDISQDHQRMFFRHGGLASKTAKDMERSLTRIAELTATSE